MDEPIDIMVFPLIQSQFKAQNDRLRFLMMSEEEMLKKTEIIDYAQVTSIVARPRIAGTASMSYFNSFDLNVWLAYFTFLILFSFFVASINKDIKHYMEYLWTFSTMVINKSFQQFINRLCSSQKILFSVWVVFSSLITIAFSSFLLEYMQRPDPVIVIDSVEDMASVQNMKFFVSNESALYDYLSMYDSELANSIRPKLVYHLLEEMLNTSLILKFIDGLRQGTHGMVNEKLFLIGYISNMDFMEARIGKKQAQNILDLVHFSTNGDNLPIYVATMNRITPQVKLNFNQM